MLFALAVIGLIGAACVSGLPSATCYALADAYVTILERLTSSTIYIIIIGFGGIMVLNMIIKGGETHELMKRSTLTLAFMGFLLAIFLLPVIFLLSDGISNVRLAINHCLEGTAEDQHNLHDRIPLHRGRYSVAPTLR